MALKILSADRHEEIEYKEKPIYLVRCPKKDSPLSIPPMVWYWHCNGNSGWAKRKEVALDLAKRDVDILEQKKVLL